MGEQANHPGKHRGRWWGALALAGLLAAVGYWAGNGGNHKGFAAPPPDLKTDPGVGGIKLFALWPKDAKPDAVVVLSGQSFGLLQPCGCSRPQLGGLERRANFMKGMRDKGWPVIGADLGDIYPNKSLVEEQASLKYITAMKSLKEMGYVAVGLGKSEFDHGLIQVLGAYALQTADPPQILAGNLVGLRNGAPVPAAQEFPRGPGQPPMIELTDVKTVGTVPVGFAGTIGPSLADQVMKQQGNAALIGFQGNNVVLPEAIKQFAANKLNPAIRILLYQGSVDEAKKVAEAFPEFSVILCQSDDPEPPQFPVRHAGPKHPQGSHTLIIETGHKGRYVGALGIFKKGNNYELHYQLVPLTEDYWTPDDPKAVQSDKVLALLEDYAKQVKDRDLLGKYSNSPRPHPYAVQVGATKMEYVGSEKCMGCHAAEYAVWKGTGHSHALDALVKVAKKPGQRNFDAECVQCHVVGLGYQSGYTNEAKTPHLAHVGCESCHGPGSAHAANPRNKALLGFQSFWKKTPQDVLPDVPTMQKLAELNPAARSQVPIPPAQRQTMNVVMGMCMRCHDMENDPHFDLEKYWPKIAHSNLNAGGLPPAPGAIKKALPVPAVPVANPQPLPGVPNFPTPIPIPTPGK